MTRVDLAEQRWRQAAVANLADAVIALDAGGRVTFMNRAAEALTGKDLEDVRGRPLAEAAALLDEGTRGPLDLPAGGGQGYDSVAAVAAAAAADGSVTQRALCADARGGERLLDITLIPVRDDDGPCGSVLVLRDVTAQVRTERALRDSEERYRAFVEQSSEGIWRAELARPMPIDFPEDEQIEIFYRDGVVAESNLVMAQIHGLPSPSEMIGTRLEHLLPRSDARHVEHLRTFIRSGYQLSGAEWQGNDRDGTLRHFLNHLTGVVENGCLVRIWGTQVDITSHKRLEEELRQRAEELLAADRRKDQFLAMMAHELRNPLAPIRNAVELMRQVETADASFHASRAMVERQVKNLARLVDDLLDVSRITHGNIRLRKEAIDLRTIVERAVEATRPLIEARGHDLVVELPPSPVRLEVDPTRMEQVFANLLDNAAKYTMPEGRIRLTAVRAGAEVVVRVRDTGIGVPADVLGRVFEPFVQSDGSLARSEGGLGIGLTLVRSLVEMHGGSVEAHSAGLGQGSEFVVRLPGRGFELVGEGPAGPADPRFPARARSIRVLVVEDNVDAAESLATLLRLWNHRVSVVHDGAAAIEVARSERPEVILLDIGLPGLDGYQVARQLREEVGLRGALMVAMTGYGQPEDRRRSQEAGIHYHFVKPVEPVVLRSLLSGRHDSALEDRD
ncbi:MAG TPA: ATP-binding protein [Thermoanaerobaculia bacterium]|nr:ATP-binding protein [Thermoanaerobaculia bacterium]